MFHFDFKKVQKARKHLALFFFFLVGMGKNEE